MKVAPFLVNSRRLLRRCETLLNTWLSICTRRQYCSYPASGAALTISQALSKPESGDRFCLLYGVLCWPLVCEDWVHPGQRCISTLKREQRKCSVFPMRKTRSLPLSQLLIRWVHTSDGFLAGRWIRYCIRIGGEPFSFIPWVASSSCQPKKE